jgi:hypothetical protein
MLIEVRRETLSPCTIGTMSLDGEPFGNTLELAWDGNKPRVSCIPAGTYEVKITPSFRFKRPMLEIIGVPGRAGIRIHGANHDYELRGCLAVSIHRYRTFGLRGSLAGVLQEKVAAALLRGEAVKISISNPPIA